MSDIMAAREVAEGEVRKYFFDEKYLPAVPDNQMSIEENGQEKKPPHRRKKKDAEKV